MSTDRQRFLDKDEVVHDHNVLRHIVNADVLVYFVALLFHELDVLLFARPAVYVFCRQYAHVQLMKRNRSQNL